MFDSGVSPTFVTVMWNVAVPPTGTDWLGGFFVTLMAGCRTSTGAVSVLVTLPPTDGVPVAVAELVKLAVLPVTEQSY